MLGERKKKVMSLLDGCGYGAAGWVSTYMGHLSRKIYVSLFAYEHRPARTGTDGDCADGG